MPRPKRPRCISSHPTIREFRPHGVREQGEISLSLEEFEVIRIIDFEGLDQSQAAEMMNVSRQTVGRILKTGRYKLSNALVTPLRLKVEGGCYRIHGRGHGNGHGPHGRGMGRNFGGKGAGRRQQPMPDQPKLPDQE